jgi:O-acetyl-ADP-ribose deacetylase (regulator of RNase III)
MKIILSAVEPELVTAWERFCGDLEFVEIHQGSILTLSCDAVVSPANSFGFMDGGIDMLYSQHFGRQVQERLQRLILNKHQGELLVGAAEIVETGNLQIPYLIAAPTMRVPMVLRNSVNPYLAARAALLLVKHGAFASGHLKGEPVASFVDSLAFPGLGTGVGRVGPNTCARQVRAAIEEVIMGKHEFPQSWADAQKRHQQLFTDQIRDLQYE